MYLDAARVSGLVLLGAVAGATGLSIDESKFKAADIISRDVAIIGGGASGAYSAVRIKDSGKTVAVIEKCSRLGGHVDTFTDPTTHIPIDYGVQAYLDLPTQPSPKSFFARFNIPVETAPNPPFKNMYIDFSTGKVVPGYPSADQNAQNVALGTYAQICAQYNSMIFPGYYNLTVPVPEDLAMPFGQFVKKYNIQAAVPIIWNFANAVGDILNLPTINVMRNFGAVHVQALSTGGFFIPSSHNNSALYAAIASQLGRDVLYSSTVSTTVRDAKGVKLVVNGPHGSKKLIKAKRLLVTIPPTKSNMYPFDLDSTESGIFAKWQWSNLFAGIFSHSNIPDGLELINTTPNNASLNLPKPPFVWSHTFTGVPGLYKTEVIGGPGLSAHDAKELVRDSVNKMGAAHILNVTHLDFEAFADHSPIQLRPSASNLKAGFYSSLYSLQGRRHTFYTGSSWTSDYTTIIWLFTETVLPRLLAGL